MERFTIGPVSGNGTTLVLGDDSISSPRNIILAPRPMPAPEIQLQTAMPVRAVESVTYARGCAVTTYNWFVVRTHASISEALQFERDHALAIVNGFSLGQFILTREVFGVSMRSVGAIKTPKFTEGLGVRTVCEYQWQGTLFAPIQQQ